MYKTILIVILEMMEWNAIWILQHPNPSALQSFSILILQHPNTSAPQSFSLPILQHTSTSVPQSFSLPILQHPNPSVSQSFSIPILQHPNHSASQSFSIPIQPLLLIQWKFHTLLVAGRSTGHSVSKTFKYYLLGVLDLQTF